MSSFNQLVEAELGPAFIGFTISLWLYGTTLSQTIFYLRSFPDDSRATKCLVCFLCLVDTFHVYLLGHLFWNVLVTGPSIGLSVLLTIPWQLLASFVIIYFVISVVHGFFGLKVWRLSGRNWMVILIIGISSAGQLVSGMVFSGHLIKVKSLFLAFDRDGTLSGRIQLICSLICDLAISGSLVYYFSVFRAGIEKSKHILQHLIVLSINMGVLLCLVTVVTLILFQVESGSFVSLAPHFILSKLYVNSLLATLNSRKHFRAIADETVSYSLPTIPDTNSTAHDSTV